MARWSSHAEKCVPGGARTHNLLIRSQMLYPIELQTRLNFRFWILDFRLDQLGSCRSCRWLFLIIQSKIGNLKSKMEWGGRRDSNPQQPEPQSGALPLSYDHQVTA